MDRNPERCAHCGELFIQVEKVPFINRTNGKDFHVSLFAGPNPRPNASGGFFCWSKHMQLFVCV